MPSKKLHHDDDPWAKMDKDLKILMKDSRYFKMRIFSCGQPIVAKHSDDSYASYIFMAWRASWLDVPHPCRITNVPPADGNDSKSGTRMIRLMIAECKKNGLKET